MAKQSSPLVKLRGTIDDLSFYKSQDGYLAREKGGVSAERIRTDPKFRRTYLNGLEFGTAGKAGKLFRSAWKTEIGKAADNRLTSRITRQMVSVLQTDPVNGLGERRVELGNFTLLNDLEFNINVKLEQVFDKQVTPVIDRDAGTVIFNLPAIIPATDIVLPEGDTHFSLFVAAAEVDFANNLSITDRKATTYLPWNTATVAASALSLNLSPGTTMPIFAVLGIEFVKIVNTKVYPSSTGQSALRLVALNLPTP